MFLLLFRGVNSDLSFNHMSYMSKHKKKLKMRKWFIEEIYKKKIVKSTAFSASLFRRVFSAKDS